MDATSWRLGRRPSLDAVRGIAVLLVLAGHFGMLPENAATTGVALFFTLSGFLITALLLGELADSGRVDMRAFYIRRARRLLPALALLVAGLAAVHAVAGDLASWLPRTWPVALYVGNWGYLAGVLPHDLSHTWSLAIEEQFYLLWPAAFVLLARSGRALVGTVGLIGLSLLVSLPDWPAMGAAYYGSPERAKDLLAGAIVAIACARLGRDLALRPATLAAAAIPIAASAVLPLPGGIATPFLPLACAIVVAWFAAHPSALAWRPLTGTGRISYGLYLYHYPLIGLAAWPVLTAASFALAGMSWIAVERRFLAGRRVPRAAELAPQATGEARRARGSTPRSSVP
jgi:peptidoglycan/LPS O-acetylase OafA/YrhL